MTISGDPSGILTALHLIFSKITNETKEKDPSFSGLPIQVLLPNGVVGGIIGKGGATIQNFQVDSGAAIKIQPKEQQLPGATLRIVSITGLLDQQLRAVALIITNVVQDANYADSSASPIAYGTGVGSSAPMPFGQPQVG